MAIETVEQISRLWPIDSIVVKDRKRALGDISMLRESIQELGLLNPITILPDSTLIAGYHRMEACKALGWRFIPVNVVPLDKLNAELAEIDENLIRNELHWFDRDKHLARRKEIYEALHPETLSVNERGGPGRGHKTSEIISLVSTPTFAEDAASKTGQSVRNVELSIQRAHTFTEEDGEILKQAQVTQTEATKIARLDESDRQTLIEKMKLKQAHIIRVMGSSESPEWYTPQAIVRLVQECLGEIDLDPCSNSHEHPAVPARMLYTKEDDGLAQPWRGKVYLNPPYGAEIPAWIEKLVHEYEALDNVTEALALLPARIDTQWFQPLYAYPLCHIRGRLQFENAHYSAPFPSILVYLGNDAAKFIETFKDLGPIMRRIG